MCRAQKPPIHRRPALPPPLTLFSSTQSKDTISNVGSAYYSTLIYLAFVILAGCGKLYAGAVLVGLLCIFYLRGGSSLLILILLYSTCSCSSSFILPPSIFRHQTPALAAKKLRSSLPSISDVASSVSRCLQVFAAAEFISGRVVSPANTAGPGSSGRLTGPLVMRLLREEERVRHIHARRRTGLGSSTNPTVKALWRASRIWGVTCLSRAA